MKLSLAALAVAMLVAAPSAIAKDKEPIMAVNGDFAHVTSFKLKEESFTKLLNDQAEKGYRFVTVTGQLPQEVYFQKSAAKYEYKIASKMALTTTKQLEVIAANATDGWNLAGVMSETPSYTFVFEREKKATQPGG